MIINSTAAETPNSNVGVGTAEKPQNLIAHHFSITLPKITPASRAGGNALRVYNANKRKLAQITKLSLEQLNFSNPLLLHKLGVKRANAGNSKVAPILDAAYNLVNLIQSSFSKSANNNAQLAQEVESAMLTFANLMNKY